LVQPRWYIRFGQSRAVSANSQSQRKIFSQVRQAASRKKVSRVQSGEWERFIPHYRLRDPAFFRMFQLMTTISRTFRKMGKAEEVRLVRGSFDQFRRKTTAAKEHKIPKGDSNGIRFLRSMSSFVAILRSRLDFGAKNQAKSNQIKPAQTKSNQFGNYFMRDAYWGISVRTARKSGGVHLALTPGAAGLQYQLPE